MLPLSLTVEFALFLRLIPLQVDDRPQLLHTAHLHITREKNIRRSRPKEIHIFLPCRRLNCDARSVPAPSGSKQTDSKSTHITFVQPAPASPLPRPDVVPHQLGESLHVPPAPPLLYGYTYSVFLGCILSIGRFNKRPAFGLRTLSNIK